MKENYNIEDYLNGKLSTEGQAAFEAYMQADKDFALEVEMQRFEKETMELMVEDRLMDRIQQINQRVNGEQLNSPATKAKRFRLLPYISSIAATVLMLIVAGYFWVQRAYSNESIVNKFYDYNISTLRKGESQEDPFEQGKSLYEQKSYKEAIQSFSGLLNIDSLSIQAQFYIAHSQFKDENYKDAKDQFLTISKMSTSEAGPLPPQAKWYWLLSKVALGEIDSSFQTGLEELVQKGDGRAKRLDKDLSSVWRSVVN